VERPSGKLYFSFGRAQKPSVARDPAHPGSGSQATSTAEDVASTGLDDPYDDYFCFWGTGGGGGCPPPSAAELAAQLPSRLDIGQMLRLGAVNALIENADAPLLKDNNYHWYDWPGGRVYLAWDLDTTMNHDVDPFASSSYTDVLFTNWRGDYETVLRELVDERLSLRTPSIEGEVKKKLRRSPRLVF